MLEGSLEVFYRKIADKIYGEGIPEKKILGLLYRGTPGVDSEERKCTNYVTLREERVYSKVCNPIHKFRRSHTKSIPMGPAPMGRKWTIFA